MLASRAEQSARDVAAGRPDRRIVACGSARSRARDPRTAPRADLETKAAQHAREVALRLIARNP